MNAARLAKGMIEDGIDPKLAQSLSEHLADEIDRTVATRDQVELIVTREVQQLRVEMHQEIQALRSEIQGVRTDTHEQIQGLRTDTHEQIQALRSEIQGVRTDIHKQIQGLRTDTHEQIQGLRSEMHQELRRLSERIDDSFTTQFRWMIGMFVTVMVAVVVNLGAVVLGIVIG